MKGKNFICQIILGKISKKGAIWRPFFIKSNMVRFLLVLEQVNVSLHLLFYEALHSTGVFCLTTSWLVTRIHIF